MSRTDPSILNVPLDPSKPTPINIPYSPHKYQRLIHDSSARFRVICAGRKWGKTTMCALEAFRYLGKPNSVVWWCAPFQNVAQIGWRRFNEVCPSMIVRHVNRKGNSIELINNSVIEFKTTENEDALVGEGLDLLILDEAARIKERTWLETLRPNLDDPGHLGHALIISTPRSKNWFYEAWMLGQQKKFGYESWSMPFQDMQGGFPSWSNPYFKKDNLEEASNLPELIFNQEYCARFLDDLGAVFRDVLKARDGELEDPKPDVEYVAGVDWAKTGDYTVGVVLDASGHLVAYDRFRKASWAAQVNRIATLLKPYNARAVCDSTGLGDPVFDMLYKEYQNISSIVLNTNNKADIIENLAIMIERGAKRLENGVTYPDIPDMIDELSMFGMSQKTNTIKYEAPRGFHDDFVLALSFAAWQLKKSASEAGYTYLDERELFGPPQSEQKDNPSLDSKPIELDPKRFFDPAGVIF